MQNRQKRLRMRQGRALSAETGPSEEKKRSTDADAGTQIYIRPLERKKKRLFWKEPKILPAGGKDILRRDAAPANLKDRGKSPWFLPSGKGKNRQKKRRGDQGRCPREPQEKRHRLTGEGGGPPFKKGRRDSQKDIHLYR